MRLILAVLLVAVLAMAYSMRLDDNFFDLDLCYYPMERDPLTGLCDRSDHSSANGFCTICQFCIECKVPIVLKRVSSCYDDSLDSTSPVENILTDVHPFNFQRCLGNLGLSSRSIHHLTVAARSRPYFHGLLRTSMRLK